jgi:hypothetical protein
MNHFTQPTTRVIPSGARDLAKRHRPSSHALRDLRDWERICEVPRRLRDSG